MRRDNQAGDAGLLAGANNPHGIFESFRAADVPALPGAWTYLDAGYLTRKLVDVCQNVVVTHQDCGTLNGVSKGIVNIYGRITSMSRRVASMPLYGLSISTTSTAGFLPRIAIAQG